MNEAKIRSLVDRIKKGMSTKEEDIILEELIASGRLSINDFDEINHLSENLLNHLLIEPPKSMDERFYQMLSHQTPQIKQRIIRPWILGMVAGFTLLLGLIGGYLMRQNGNVENQKLLTQLNSLKEEVVISKLDNKSTSARLQAVGLTQEMQDVSKKLSDALLYTINNDPSDNVRIASIEALIPFSHLETVRGGLINAIAQQKSPLVLISLAEALKKVGASQSADQFKNQINKDMPPSITEAFEKDLQSILIEKL
ncbi:MAG: HEAT repeat domain-containing protein [Saprospiraceae bacterium]|nr:HEAT repeat domain-containing protein [Saprospiraceae bacterium]